MLTKEEQLRRAFKRILTYHGDINDGYLYNIDDLIDQLLKEVTIRFYKGDK